MYTIEVSGLDKISKAMENANVAVENVMRRAMQQCLVEVTNRAKKNAPFKTGRLRRSIFPTYKSIIEGEVSTATSYAKTVEEGSRPHIITPKKAKVLAFKSGGKMVFAKKVSHPGFSGRWYMKRTASETEGIVRGVYGRAVKQLSRELLGLQ